MRIQSFSVISGLICAMVAGCAAAPSDLDEAQADQSIKNFAAFTLSISGEEAAIRITTTNVSDTCPQDDSCQFGFVGGSVLTIRPSSTQNLVDCLRFNGWTGACAGQGSTCTVTINSDITVGENFWTRISGCIPK